MDIKDIAKITNGRLINPEQPQKIEKFIIDSRKAQKETFFVPLKGENTDGHNFIQNALENGSVGYFSEKEVSFPNGILVDNTLDALTKVGKYKRNNLQKAVGITGTAGKTTTKELLKLVLSQFFKTYGTEGNYNNHIGLPLTLSNIPENTEIGVFELGANKKGDISELVNILEPDITVLTTVGDAHNEGFGTFKDIVEAKGEIFDTGEFAVLPEFFLPYYESKLINYITFGTESDADIQISDVKITDIGIKGTIKYKKEKIILEIPTFNKAIFHNIGAVAGVLYALGLDPLKPLKILEDFKEIEGRFKTINKGNLTIIDDTYNSNPLSLKNLIDVLNAFKEKKVIVIGDMLELGQHSEKLHREIGQYLLSSNIDKIYLYGDEVKFIKDVIGNKKDLKHFPSKKELSKDLLKEIKNENAVIGIKGSRGMKMEDVVNHLLNA